MVDGGNFDWWKKDAFEYFIKNLVFSMLYVCEKYCHMPLLSNKTFDYQVLYTFHFHSIEVLLNDKRSV